MKTRELRIYEFKLGKYPLCFITYSQLQQLNKCIRYRLFVCKSYRIKYFKNMNLALEELLSELVTLQG